MTDKTQENTMYEPIKDIKFRAWHKSLKQIFEVHSLYYSGGTLFWVDLVQNGFVEHEYVDIDNVVMLQYTNMKDKKNKELYEYDVVEVDEHFEDDGNLIPKRLYVIRMIEGCYELYALDDCNKHIDKQYYLSGLNTHVLNNRITRIMNLDEYLENQKKVEQLAKLTKVGD